MQTVARIDDARLGLIGVETRGDGGEIHRKVVSPGHYEGVEWVQSELSSEPDEVIKLANDAWSPEVISAWRELCAKHLPPPPSTKPESYPLSARQLRLGLIDNGYSLADIVTILDAIADPVIRDQAQVWWEFTNDIHWDHDWTQILIAMMGISKEQAAAMWMSAKDIVA